MEASAKTYNFVNEKLHEADFFLDRMADCPPEFETFRFYFSAFCSSCRGATFALQYVGRKFDRFDQWYEPVQDRLKEDPLARLFNEFRTDTQKKGINPVNRATSDPQDPAGKLLYYFCSVLGEEPAGIEKEDVLTLSKKYMGTVVGVIREFYEEFSAEIENDSDEEAMYREALKQLPAILAAAGFPPGRYERMVSDSKVMNALAQPPWKRIEPLFKRYES